MMNMFFGFDMMTGMMSLLFPLVFGLIVVVILRMIRQWHYNNKQPVLTVDAVCVAKRQEYSRHMHNDGLSSSTWYYATFEVESGDRMELAVGGRDYGLLVEGDSGRLTFQGTRFLGFERL
jgi:hypothetical protein